MVVSFPMSEDGAGAGEASCWQCRWMLRSLGLFQGLEQDAFHAEHVDEVHLQGTLAGGVQAFGGVALLQADELVALPYFGPRQRTVKEALGEFGHRRTLLGGAALDAVGGPEGVSAQLGRVVLGVGGPPASRLAGVNFNQATPVVDAHQLEAQPDLHLLPRGHRADGTE